jgi:hypothetical protein
MNNVQRHNICTNVPSSQIFYILFTYNLVTSWCLRNDLRHYVMMTYSGRCSGVTLVGWDWKRLSPPGVSASSLNIEAEAKQIPSMVFSLFDRWILWQVIASQSACLPVWVQIPKPDILFEYSWFPHVSYQEIEWSLSFSSRLKFTKFCVRKLCADPTCVYV